MLNSIEVITLFVDSISNAKAFYEAVFKPEVIYEDDVSSVLKFESVMVNLLQISQAPELVEPLSVGSAKSGVPVLLTIKVADVDATCATFVERGVTLLNGPINRPWGRRKAAFADPSGHVWEIAQELS